MRTVKILTQNAWFSNRDKLWRMNALSNMTQHEAVDIVALQEVTQSTIDTFRKLLFWKEFPHRYSENIGSSYGTFIMSKFPFYDKQNIRFEGSEQGRTVRHVSVKLPWNSNLIVGNVHLESPPGNEARRRQQLEFSLNALQLRMKEETNMGAILLGDFNAIPSDKPIHLLNGWQDCWVALKGEDDPGETYDFRKNRYVQGEYTGRLDRVVTSGGAAFTPVAVDIVSNQEEYLCSDHFGLVVTISAS